MIPIDHPPIRHSFKTRSTCGASSKAKRLARSISKFQTLRLLPSKWRAFDVISDRSACMTKRVKVFTMSGTFRGDEGVIVEECLGGVRVLLDNAAFPMFFTRNELVILDDEHHAGAE